MNLEIEAMALELPEVAGHPNRLAFHGVLTLVGVASQRPPSGARGHRVMLTRKATEAALPSLLGMALDYTPALDSHDARRKIGIITEAEIVALKAGKSEVPQGLKPDARDPLPAQLYSLPKVSENTVPRGLKSAQEIKYEAFDGTAEAVPLQNNVSPEVLQQLVKPWPFKANSATVSSADPAGQIAISGYLYAHDFPDVVDELRAGHGSLGMSYEIADAFVVSPVSPVWTVTSFTFTGAAVLRREKTAYPETWFAINQAAPTSNAAA